MAAVILSQTLIINDYGVSALCSFLLPSDPSSRSSPHFHHLDWDASRSTPVCLHHSSFVGESERIIH